MAPIRSVRWGLYPPTISNGRRYFPVVDGRPGRPRRRRNNIACASEQALGFLRASAAERSGSMTSSPVQDRSDQDEALAWTPAWRLRQMFERRSLSPLEFAQVLLARVERHAGLGAF